MKKPLTCKRVTCYTSHVTHHTSHITRHTSHVTRHTSHVTSHKSHVTRHSRLLCARGSSSFHSSQDPACTCTSNVNNKNKNMTTHDVNTQHNHHNTLASPIHDHHQLLSHVLRSSQRARLQIVLVAPRVAVPVRQNINSKSAVKKTREIGSG